jgi:hypothetical protein
LIQLANNEILSTSENYRRTVENIVSEPGSRFRPPEKIDVRNKENKNASPLRKTLEPPKPFIQREGDINPDELIKSLKTPET